MSLRIQFDLSERDLKHFKAISKNAKQVAGEVSEDQIVKSAVDLLKKVGEAKTPDFIHERLMQLQCMIDMLRDNDWALSGKDRERVLAALAYFLDPEDMIPDATPGFGFLDDAIMVELMVRELKHELDAFSDFCKFRTREMERRGDGEKLDREDWIKTKRQELHSRMRRRRSSSSRGGTGVRFKLL